MASSPINFYSAAWRGGAGWFVQALAEALAEVGGNVRLIAPRADPEDREPQHQRVKRMYVPRGASGKGGKLYRAMRVIYRIIWTFPALLVARFGSRDFLITHMDWLQVAVLQLTWIRLIGGRITFIIHDATPHAWAFPERFRGLERALWRYTLKVPVRLVTLTEVARSEVIEKYGINPEKVAVIPHGAFASSPPTMLPGGGKVLVFGMLRRNKRILESLEAMKRLAPESSLRMIIAGAPHAEDVGYWRACQAIAETVGDRVRTEIGFVEEARVDELLAECDAVLLPYEEFNSASGVAILATLAERLLICTDVGGMGELMNYGLEPIPVARPVSGQSIADALTRFEAMPVVERQSMARRSREKLTGYLSWDRIAQEYLNLLGKRAGSRS